MARNDQARPGQRHGADPISHLCLHALFCCFNLNATGSSTHPRRSACKRLAPVQTSNHASSPAPPHLYDISVAGEAHSPPIRCSEKSGCWEAHSDGFLLGTAPAFVILNSFWDDALPSRQVTTRSPRCPTTRKRGHVYEEALPPTANRAMIPSAFSDPHAISRSQGTYRERIGT